MAELQKLIKSKNKAEVIRRALGLYDFVVKSEMEGNTFCIRDSKGKLKKVVLGE